LRGLENLPHDFLIFLSLPCVSYLFLVFKHCWARMVMLICVEISFKTLLVVRLLSSHSSAGAHRQKIGWLQRATDC